MLPSDPSIPRSAVFEDSYDPLYGLFDALKVPRATAQARFAADQGLDFPQVRTRRRFVRIRTRQEVWDDTNAGSPPPPSAWVPGEYARCWELYEQDSEECFTVWYCTPWTRLQFTNNTAHNVAPAWNNFVQP